MTPEATTPSTASTPASLPTSPNSVVSTTSLDDAPLDLLSPELLQLIATYLATRKDFTHFTSTCRRHRSLFHPYVWSLALVKKHGKDKVLADEETYGNTIVRINNLLPFPMRVSEAPFKFRTSDIISQLVKLGADIHVHAGRYAVDDFPLFYACISGNLNLVNLILGKGGRPDSRGVALQHIAAHGFPEIFRALLKNGGTEIAKKGSGVLKTAIRYSKIESVRILLENGIKVPDVEEAAAPEEQEEHLLTTAVKAGKFEVVELLVEKGGANVRANRCAALDWAASDGRVDLVEYLIRKGGGPTPTQRESLALVMAAEGGHVPVVKMLLEAGADVHTRQDTPLRWATTHGRTEVVRLLVEAGANVNVTNGEPLTHACQLGFIDIVKILLAAGADIHINHGKSLVEAAKGGHVEIVRILLERGAKEECLKKTNTYRIVKKKGYTEIEKMLHASYRKAQRKKKKKESIAKRQAEKARQEQEQRQQGVGLTAQVSAQHKSTDQDDLCMDVEP
ncbi:hypothetical protein HK102_011476 [Quaeritorhiza haematococci]|nr:hypothetical protein HK102_011476 [Quaeritorhiza haematococci]